ncbi:MAG: GGDEF domain-containing protein [Pseudomonadota bacterium]
MMKGGRSLGTRLVLATLGFCFVFTLLTVGVRTYSAWNEAWAAMDADLTLLEQVYRQTLSKAVWEMDRDALRAHIDSTAQVAAVGRITLTIRSNNRKPEVVTRSAQGWQASTLTPTRHLDLVYEPFPGGAEGVGELTLAGDERVLWTRLRGEVQSIVLTQLLQSLLLAGLIMLMFSRSVTVHVQQIAQHLGQITPDSMRQTLRLARDPRHRDELTLLETGVNQLQDKLADHLAQLQQYENELGAHRDHLADLVQARTAELESLTQAQQLVLSLSNRLIHAPHESFNACQQDCLAEVSVRLGANHALWLVPTGVQPAFRVFTEWRPDDAVPTASEPLPLQGMAQVPARLAREELLFFFSQAEMGRSLSPQELAVFTSEPVGACALALLRSDGEDYGILFIGRPLGQGDWPSEDRALLALTAQMLLHSVRHHAQLLNIVATQEALRAANRQLEELSLHDPLTGLFNRRHFDDVKEDEFQRALRSGKPLSLLVCDIDYFKTYNDEYGHAQGDQCLRDVARAMDGAINRSGDALARIGGEEFAILLPATTEAAALQVADRVRLAVVGLQIAHAGSLVGPWVTISIGLAQLRFGRITEFHALFEAADQALYRAKQNGRNRVESSVAPPPPSVS